MAKIAVRADIEAIFDKPGREWTPAERQRVETWLNEDPQLPYLLRHARWHLGPGTTTQDAEDAWVEFYLSSLDGVIASYDPRRGRRFWNYLLFCFERFCHEKGEQIRRRQQQEGPWPTARAEEGERLQIEFAAPHPSGNPLEVLERRERLLALIDCLDQLPPRLRDVIVLYYLEERPVAEVGQRLGITAANVKVRLFRARHLLRECLRGKGWLP